MSESHCNKEGKIGGLPAGEGNGWGHNIRANVPIVRGWEREPGDKVEDNWNSHNTIGYY
jgi:hypothetical protein